MELKPPGFAKSLNAVRQALANVPSIPVSHVAICTKTKHFGVRLFAEDVAATRTTKFNFSSGSKAKTLSCSFFGFEFHRVFEPTGVSETIQGRI
jgi:hypothetical protein